MNQIVKYCQPHQLFLPFAIPVVLPLLSLLTVIVPGTLHAGRGHGTTVLIAQDTQMSGFERRIKAELEASGFNVEMFKIDFREDTQRIIDVRAHAQNAAAAIVCRQSAGFVEIWIADNVTDKNVLRRIQIPHDEDAESFVAISTVELLRASLLEIHTVAELKGSVKPTPVIEKLIAPKPGDRASMQAFSGNPPGRMSLQINPAIMLMRLNDNPMLNIQIGASILLFKQLELKLHGQSPIISQRISRNEGKIAVKTGFAAVGISWVLVYPRHIASADVGTGMSVMFLRGDGEPFEGNTGAHQTFAIPAPYLQFGMDVRLFGKTRIRLDTLAGWTLSPLNIYVNNEKAVVYGNFFVSVGVGLLFLL